jgi:hypothetical protein
MSEGQARVLDHDEDYDRSQASSPAKGPGQRGETKGPTVKGRASTSMYGM